MIGRYTLAPMGMLWSDDTKYDIWANVEAAAALAQGAPDEILDVLMSGHRPDVRMVEVEEVHTRHDVQAFINVWRNRISPEAGAWVHRNMTSSDLVDSANAVRLHYVNEAIREALQELLHAMATHAIAHRDSRRAARTHGQHAQESSWGYRVADITMGLQRAFVRFDHARENAEVGKLSGPVGDNRYVSPDEEKEFCRKLGINARSTATQIVMRDGYADLVFALSQIASVIEAFALEVRLSQRTEVGELFEGRVPEQVGSSAMPHKRNPATSEQLCGLAKLVRAQIVPIQEGVAQHHEHDLSHSSVERIALQTATVLTHYMIKTTTALVINLVVDRARMLDNLRSSGGLLDSATLRNQMVDQGVEPEAAWDVVAEASNQYQHQNADSSIPLVNLVWDVYAKRFPTRGPLPFTAVPEPQTGRAFDMMEAIAHAHRS